MSSPGHWEVVSKNKKSKQNGQSSSKLSKTEKKKFAENAPKVEDILSLAQVKNLYADDAASDVQEPKRPKEPKPKEEPKKAKDKKQPEKKKEPKEKIQKHSYELDEDQLLAFISEAQSSFSDVPLAWLRDFASYISRSLPPNFAPSWSGRNTVNWPSSLLPPKVCSKVKSVILAESTGSQLAFFSSCMTSLANDLSKGHSAIGQKILLQTHIDANPEIVGMSVDKLTALRNSYLNRPQICLEILDIVGQAGLKDISTGMKIWSEVMFPLTEMRHYTRWIISYIGHMATVHIEAVKLSGLGNRTTDSFLSASTFIPIVNRTMPIGNSLTSQVQKELLPVMGLFRSLAIEQSEQEEIEEFFLLYLLRLLPSSQKVLQNELIDGLEQCLLLQPSCFAVWQEAYEKHLGQSIVLLRYLSTSTMKPMLIGEPLCQCLQHFQSVNESLMAGGEDKVKNLWPKFSWDDLEESSRLAQEFLQQAKSSTKGKGFPYIKGSFFCLLGIIGLIIYDVNRHGAFRDSSVGRLALDAGALPTIEWMVVQVQHSCDLIQEWLGKNGPIYLKAVAEVVGPILANGMEAAHHLTSSTYTYLVELYPVIMNWIDNQVPGFRDKCAEYLSEGWQIFLSGSWWTMNICSEYAATCFQWAKENVFVGQLSAENLQKLSLEAYNMTQMYAGLTIDWIVEKIQ